MKNKLIAVLAVIAIFIPSFLAVGSYFWAEKSPTETGRITELKIADTNGKSYTVADEAVIGEFLEMNEGATSIDSLPDPLVSADFFLVTYTVKSGKSADFKYYFSLDATEAYYIDDKGAAYKIKEGDATGFLATEYASCLYVTAKAPSLTVSALGVLPETITWKYKTGNGKFTDLTDIQKADSAAMINVDGALDFTFDIDPDLLEVKITKGTEVIFDDTYDKMGGLKLDENADLTVKLNAKWYEDDARDYFGEASYTFGAKISAPAAFYLVQNEILPGEFVVLTGKNISDISKISFTSTPSIDYTPVFFEDGDYVRALIPIKMELENKSYVFKLGYGSTYTQELNLTIADKTFKKQTYEISQSVVDSTRSEAALSAFKQTMEPIAKSALSERLWSGTFSEGVRSDAILMTGFGLYRTISATGETYRHLGVDYYMTAGSPITAVNAGKVIYVGITDHSGKTVVVDHGFGLKSWYANMNEYVVAVGDTVEKDQQIGVIGTTGFVNGRTAHIGLSVFDVPVCPYDLWENGIKMYNE